ncbi:MAG: high-affinity iron transporter [Candidatus Nitrosomirales archaeon]|jgi:high-affinity iron transporter
MYSTGHKILSLSLGGLLLLSISSFVGKADALTTEEYVVFVSSVEKIKAQLEIVKQNLNSNSQVAFAHSSVVGKLASQIEKPLRESNRALADDLYLNMIDLPALVKSGTKQDVLLSHISEGELLLDKATIAVVPNALRSDSSFYAQIIFVLLTNADQEYEKASDDGYNSAIAYVDRSHTIFREHIGKDTSVGGDPDLDSFGQSFVNIIEKMRARADFNTVTSAISEPQRVVLAWASVGTNSEYSKYFDAIRTLLQQVVKEYKAGNYAAADEFAIEAYLDNFEYLEPVIAEHDKDLMLTIEGMMRVELREMIKDRESVEKIEAHVQAIFEKLNDAENIPSVRTLSYGSVLTDGHVDGTATTSTTEETKSIGSAGGEAKTEVMNQVDAIRLKLIAVLNAYERGDYDSAFENARSAYLDSYEYIEIPLSPIDPNFTLEMEIKFAELRNLIQDRAPYEQVQAKVVELRKGLDESERLVTGPGLVAPSIAFSSSFSIIFREGLESALIIGAIITYLEASRNEKFKKHVYHGIVLALAASAVTWFVASFVITISGANRELIEAIAALSATGVLFYVSFWILNRIETKKWIEFVKAKVWQATTTGSVMVFVLLSFFTVYREGFETVLFYQAMFSFAKYMESYVALGFVLGLGSLLVIFYFIRRMGKKLPLKVLFALTMGVGAYLSIAFIGNGVRELQEAMYVKTTPLIGVVPRLDINLATMTGIHPTLETIVAQVALLSVYVVGMFYVLVWRSRKEQAILQARKSRADIDDAV